MAPDQGATGFCYIGAMKITKKQIWEGVPFRYSTSPKGSIVVMRLVEPDDTDFLTVRERDVEYYNPHDGNWHKAGFSSMVNSMTNRISTIQDRDSQIGVFNYVGSVIVREFLQMKNAVHYRTACPQCGSKKGLHTCALTNNY